MGIPTTRGARRMFPPERERRQVTSTRKSTRRADGLRQQASERRDGESNVSTWGSRSGVTGVPRS